MSLLPPPLLLPLKLPALLPGRSRKLGIPEPQLLFTLRDQIVLFKEKKQSVTRNTSSQLLRQLLKQITLHLKVKNIPPVYQI